MARQENDILFHEFGNPEDYELTGGILLPVTETNFTIHPQYTRMVQTKQFLGSPSEDPIEHLDRFLELCAMIKTNQVSQEYIRMHLFRQSLAGRAKKWLKQVKPNSLTTWKEIVKAFLKRFISEEKTAEMRRKIASFEQEADESWFKELVQACPHHEYNQSLLMRFFYDGLEPMSRANLDAGAGGQLIKVPQNQVEATIKEVVKNYSWGGRRRNAPKKGGKYELVKVDQLQHQIELLTKGLAKLNTNVISGESSSQVNSFSCQNCGGTNHDTSYFGGLSPEHVAAYNTSEARNLDGPVPFPSRLAERKLNDKFAKFLSVMKNLHINLPFIEIVTQMPSYSKFLKDILTNKRNLNDELITLPHQVSALVQHKMPKKQKDPGSFTLPVKIGNMEARGALADLGASVSLIPLSIAQKLNIEMIPTRKTIQLADRSVKLPCGVLEDVPIQVGHIYVPCNFVVMDMEEDVDTPLILGREALKTLGAVINCKNNTITYRLGRVVMIPQDPMVEALTCKEEYHSQEAKEFVMAIEEAKKEEEDDPRDDDLELAEEKLEESSKPPPKVELKPLPPSLK
ncbi:uncharacterized protein LOC110739625 [Chenopodium quinoa]|uniref:uncharacterized protein LOC110739625 n=1 Tax=Chenopodium quinoa TaxID=63459 RepID=UPI000B771FD1|nr:uncharacterized protein LOC110739625 [Chenopodium quinoa]